MTDHDDLRRQIAEALGWRDFEWIGPRDNHLYATAPKGFDELDRELHMEVPDWPRDTGAALALCLEIADRNRYDRLIIRIWHRPKGTYLANFLRLADEGDRPVIFRGEGATSAEALSRLALAALGEELNNAR